MPKSKRQEEFLRSGVPMESLISKLEDPQTNGCMLHHLPKALTMKGHPFFKSHGSTGDFFTGVTGVPLQKLINSQMASMETATLGGSEKGNGSGTLLKDASIPRPSGEHSIVAKQWVITGRSRARL